MQAAKIKDVIAYLESIAPPAYQEEYDNSGLLTGDASASVKGILVTLDCTEAVVAEAAAADCNLIVAHHPVIFRGLKRLTGENYVQRTIIQAIQKNIAIYAIHTNLDNVIMGVNHRIADKIGLVARKVLLPRKATLMKLVTFVPGDHVDKVLSALYEAGAGQVGKYVNCSFQLTGEGTFTPGENSQPFIGRQGVPERVKEVRVEVLLPEIRKGNVVSALKQSHPYEEAAYYLSALENEHQDVGAGLIGELPKPEEPIAFLRRLKDVMNVSVVRHTALLGHPVKVVAVCGGAGSFLLPVAKARKADVFVSADFKYHEFFDADGKITIADVGHYESEQFTKDLLAEVLSKKFTTFAVNFSKTVTNPLSYL